MLYKLRKIEKESEMRAEYSPPMYKAERFQCPHCGVFAHQNWYEVSLQEDFGIETAPDESLTLSQCSNCEKHAVWINEKLKYPVSSTAPLPLEDTPKEIKTDFLEARSIVDISPKSAAALLRLAMQKLIWHLGEGGEAIDEGIENLKKKGLDIKFQRALDSVRMTGEGAVPPGQIDPQDDTRVALLLFELLNLIVDALIAQPKKVDEILGRIPK
jgi:hypothetical protein